ncbi:hypothetical protein [Dyella choica]|uniref:Uncharacterized protein n=1 Tax=Dyella choica TaxID=1927959 RepID=A0A432M975_9GAMM|nr:hypothetical protein [Dyella choica]RUL77620.1 hypothetical protein EKH80_07010 [Dyella choica]
MKTMSYDEFVYFVFEGLFDEEGLEGDGKGNDILLSDLNHVVYAKKIFAEIDLVSSRFSEHSVSRGLQYLLDPAICWWSTFSYATYEDVREEVGTIEAMKNVFSGLFSSKCKGGLVEVGSTYESICLRWWAIFPLILVFDRRCHEIDEAIIDVMDYCLRIDNLACKRSALIGLILAESSCLERVEKVLEDNVKNYDSDLLLWVRKNAYLY